MAPAPLAGTLKRTGMPATGAPPAPSTRTASGVAKALPTAAYWLLPPARFNDYAPGVSVSGAVCAGSEPPPAVAKALSSVE